MSNSPEKLMNGGGASFPPENMKITLSQLHRLLILKCFKNRPCDCETQNSPHKRTDRGYFFFKVVLPPPKKNCIFIARNVSVIIAITIIPVKLYKATCMYCTSKWAMLYFF